MALVQTIFAEIELSVERNFDKVREVHHQGLINYFIVSPLKQKVISETKQVVAEQIKGSIKKY